MSNISSSDPLLVEDLGLHTLNPVPQSNLGVVVTQYLHMCVYRVPIRPYKYGASTLYLPRIKPWIIALNLKFISSFLFMPRRQNTFTI